MARRNVNHSKSVTATKPCGGPVLTVPLSYHSTIVEQSNAIIFPPDLLEPYIRSFYGYGSLKSNLWFVGLEEGGGQCRKEILRRLRRWEDLGKNETEDIAEFHAALEGANWFEPGSKIQSTWRQLIRAFLMAKTGRPPSDRQILTYQTDRLGRTAKRETALLELMPLPSRSVRSWIYSEADLPELRSRKTYVGSFRELRVERLRSMIKKEKPNCVVFYGARRSWPALLGVDVHSEGHFDVARTHETLLTFIAHPMSFGARTEHFLHIGSYIRAHVQL